MAKSQDEVSAGLGNTAAQERIKKKSRERTMETLKKYGVPEGYKGRPSTGDEIRAELNRRKEEKRKSAEEKINSRRK